MEAATSPLLGSRGGLVGTLGTFSDITASRAALHALRESEEQLRDQQRRLAMALDALEEDLG